jgi:hypothetical protein
MAEMYVGTIHGYCLQLLQANMPEYFKYSVLNEVQTRLLIDRGYAKRHEGSWAQAVGGVSALPRHPEHHPGGRG